MNTTAKYLVAALPALLAVTSLSIDNQDKKTTSEWKAPARAARKKNPVSADVKSVSAGKALFQQQCAVCHGSTGKGNGPAAAGLKPKPKDLSHLVVQKQVDGELYWKIRSGRSPMPPFATVLKKEQVWNLVNYVRTLAASQPKPSAEKRKTRKKKRGNARRGHDGTGENAARHQNR